MKKIFLIYTATLLLIFSVFCVNTYAYTVDITTSHYFVYEVGGTTYKIEPWNNNYLKVYDDNLGYPEKMGDNTGEITYLNRWYWSVTNHTWTVTSAVNNLTLANIIPLESNFNIYEEDGDLYYDCGVDYGGSLNTNGDMASIQITSPLDGFKQSQLSVITVYVNFQNLKYDINVPFDIHYGNSFRDDKPTYFNWVDFQRNEETGTCSGVFKVTGTVPFNTLQTITITVDDSESNHFSDSITVQCFDTFLDSNNDGKDDRTNLDNWTGAVDTEGTQNQTNNNVPTSNNPLDWLSWLSSSLTSLFNNMGTIFESVSTFGTSFISFIASVFVFLPPEMIGLLTLGLALVVILRIFKR